MNKESHTVLLDSVEVHERHRLGSEVEHGGSAGACVHTRGECEEGTGTHYQAFVDTHIAHCNTVPQAVMIDRKSAWLEWAVQW